LHLITLNDTHTHTHTHTQSRNPLDDGSAYRIGFCLLNTHQSKETDFHDPARYSNPHSHQASGRRSTP